jgi:hypothetical protein
MEYAICVLDIYINYTKDNKLNYNYNYNHNYTKNNILDKKAKKKQARKECHESIDIGVYKGGGTVHNP